MSVLASYCTVGFALRAIGALLVVWLLKVLFAPGARRAPTKPAVSDKRTTPRGFVCFRCFSHVFRHWQIDDKQIALNRRSDRRVQRLHS